MCVLAYADDITLTCLSIKGLNLILKTYNEFAIENKILILIAKSLYVLSIQSFKEKESEITQLKME